MSFADITPGDGSRDEFLASFLNMTRVQLPAAPSNTPSEPVQHDLTRVLTTTQPAQTPVNQAIPTHPSDASHRWTPAPKERKSQLAI